jgi:limonene-1,2-epoxide hydrolase
VLTDRTDYLSYRRWESGFWVCGTFEVRDGRIVLWDDHFSMGNVVAASIRGVLATVRG